MVYIYTYMWQWKSSGDHYKIATLKDDTTSGSAWVVISIIVTTIRSI